MSWLAGIFAWVMGRLFGAQTGPSPEAVAAKDSGAAEANLATETKANADITAARAASDASVRQSTADPSGLRNPDPDSRT